MKQLFSILILLSIFFSVNAQLDRSVVPQAGPAPKININKAQSFELKNGLKVFVVENHKLPILSFNLSLNIDPILEGEDAGYISLAGDLLRAGTSNRTKEQMDEQIDFIGATLNTYSNGFYASSLKKHSNELLELTSDILINPLFPQEELDKLLKQLKTGLQSQKTNPNAIAGNISQAYNFGLNHPYGEQITETTIENISIEKCKAYYDTYFKPNVSYLVIVGDINLKEAKKLTKKYFGAWKSGEVPKHTYEMPTRPEQPTVIVSNKDAAVQSVVNVTFPVDIKLSAEDYLASVVMNEVLGGGSFSGRLFQNLREQHAWTYGAYSYLSTNELIGSFKAYSQVKGEATDSALLAIKNEITRIRTELVDDEHLDLVKNSLSGSFAQSLESPQTIARFALNIEKYNLPEDFYQTYLERLAKVNAEDVLASAKKYLDPNKAYYIAVGDVSKIKESLKHLSPDNTVINVDIYGNIIKEDPNAIPEGLMAEDVINSYINALGGADYLNTVVDIVNKKEISAMGMTIDLVVKQKAPNKIRITQSMGGQVMSEQVFDGVKASVKSPQGTMELTGAQLEMMKLQATMNTELNYDKLGIQVKLVGAENIDGEKAYKIELTDPTGNVSYDYYHAENGLKLKSVSSQGATSATAEFKDYKKMNGYVYPETIIQTAGPQTITFKTIEIIVNSGIDDSEFSL